MTIAEKAGRMSAFFFAKLWSLLSILKNSQTEAYLEQCSLDDFT